ncbi:unnamed protein product [Caenorhabditis sp. 36 PRJEB53466]|nr:unnamed protein product [Caenorhabditis sp. 36 PRJEB53466]
MLTPSAVNTRKCEICFRAAYGYNYGCFTCDACKMFFRRVVLMNLKYICEQTGKCFESISAETPVPKCRACRMSRCLELGMVFRASAIFENPKDDDVGVEALVGRLLYLDNRRTNLLMSKFSLDNPGLIDLVQRKKMNIMPQTSERRLNNEEWRFFCMYSTVDFLLSLDFMSKLEPTDKLILLRHFSAKATLLFNSLRAMRAKTDKLITPGGHEVVDVELAALFNLSSHFLHQIRSRLVNKLIELEVTNEEFLLLAVVLFCNPGLNGLSENAKPLLASRQETYSSALVHYCLMSYQQTGPSRFSDLLSICHVINRNMEDIQNLTLIIKLQWPHAQCKKLFEDII